jgi:hypothetical protein
MKGKLIALTGSLDRLVYSTQPLGMDLVLRVIKGTALGMLHLHKNGISLDISILISAIQI